MADSVSTITPGTDRSGTRWAVLFIAGLASALFVVRYLAPSNVADDYHQERAIAYVLDVLCNGNWICQHGLYGEVTSKPPMLTWLAALASLPGGRATWFTVLLPGALATTGVSLLLFFAGRRFFGWPAGFLAAVAYLCSPMGAKQIALVRIEGVLSFMTALMALAGFQAWRTGRGWTWFWLAAALATLTKGPVGLLLGALGLLAVIWERRSGKPAPLRGSHLAGVAVFLALTLGWFWASYAQIGQPLIDKMIGRELVNSMVEAEKQRYPFQDFYKPTLYFLRCFLPWAVFTLLGLWRVWRQPAVAEESRRFERFACCWFVGGLACFSVAAHQRPDLVFPLVAPAALLAGRELAQGLQQVSRVALLQGAGGVAVISLVLAGVNYHARAAKKRLVQRTRGVQEIARLVETQVGREFPLVHVDSPAALQFFLNTKRPLVSLAEAAPLLKSGAAAFLVLQKPEELRQVLGPDAPALYQVARWVGDGEALYIVSNHPRLEWVTRMVSLVKPVRVEMEGIRWLRTQADRWEFASDGSRGLVRLSSTDAGVGLRIRSLTPDAPPPDTPMVVHGESAALVVPGRSRVRVTPVTLTSSSDRKP